MGMDLARKPHFFSLSGRLGSGSVVGHAQSSCMHMPPHLIARGRETGRDGAWQDWDGVIGKGSQSTAVIAAVSVRGAAWHVAMRTIDVVTS